MIMKYYLFILLFVVFVAQAQIYRSVGADGSVVFSDIEEDNSEKVSIDIAPSYTAPEILLGVIEENLEAEKAIVVIPKYKLSISSPRQNGTFQNPENIAVMVTISPELNATRDDKLIFKLDGKQIGSAQIPLNTVLTGVERGSHILLVSVIDKSGKVLKSSQSILFHVQRGSITR